MAFEARPELVGKRFLCVSGDEPPEIGDIGRWPWRSGVIRAVNHRDSDNPDLTVYVEFDDQEWDKREWVKVYEDFQLFLLEHQLVWAKRKEGSGGGGAGGGAGGLLQGAKAKHVQWPALAFKQVVGKNLLSSVTAVEFLLDRQLDFLSDHAAYQPYQDELDGQNPVLRDNPQLHEEVTGWLKDQKVQEIFMQGPYSLNGYRVRVYRQDSATQWFTGIITHHDLFSRNMVVMNDQVLEPQNVDPSMVQMTFLDDVVHSLLKGENIGITSRRRSRSSQNNNTAHMAGGRPSGTTGNTQSHYTRAHANSPRPVMTSSGSITKGSQGMLASQQHYQSQQNQQPPIQSHHSPSSCGREQREQRNSRSSRRKGSDSSVPEDDKDRREDATVRDSKSKAKQTVNKRRKCEEDEKKAGQKRPKTDMTSDLSESSDSENPHKRTANSSCSSSSSLSSSSSSSSSSCSEPNSENEFKTRTSDVKLSMVSKIVEDRNPMMQSNKMNESSSLMGHPSPWKELQATGDSKKGVVKVSGKNIPKEFEEMMALSQITQSPRQQMPVMPDTIQGSMDNKTTVKDSSQTQTPSRVHILCNNVIDITDDAQATVHQESSEAVSALLASQKAESTALSPYLPLNPSPVSSPPVPSSPLQSDAGHRPDIEPGVQLQQGIIAVGMTTARSSKIEFIPARVVRPVAEDMVLEKETTVIPHHFVPHHHQQQRQTQQQSNDTPTHPNIIPPLSEEKRKQQQPPPHNMNAVLPTDFLKSKISPNPNSSQPDSLKQYTNNYPYPNTTPSDPLKAMPHSSLLDISKPKPNTSPEVSKHKIPWYSDTSPPTTVCSVAKVDTTDSLRSGFKTVSAQSESGEGSSTKSPLIIDKNETFTVYRDPALICSEAGNTIPATVSSNHVAAYLHPHMHTLHSPSPHSPCLNPAPHTHAASHLLSSPHTSALPHPHLLPPGVLPTMPPPATSLLGGQARLDSPGGLGHLVLPHPAAAHQQQFLQGQGAPPHPLLAQAHSGATGLGLYSILWQYPNGTSTSYQPGLNLPPTAKWVHPESPVSVSSESSRRRNTASPWLHQAVGNAGDGLSLLSHVPVRPASADAQRPPVKINTHSSPPQSKACVDIHKEEVEKKGFVDPIRTLMLAQLKQERTDSARIPTGKDIHLHHLYLDSHRKSGLANTQDTLQAVDRASKYKEENRQILKESIEVAPFTAKIQRSCDPGIDRDRERDQDPAFPLRIPTLTSPIPKAVHTHSHLIQSEKSNYFTTLSNSIVNDPPRLYPSNNLSSYYGKVSIGARGDVASVGAVVPSPGILSLGNYSSKVSLSKPPPLIKHQPGGGEGFTGRITEQISQQVTLIQQQQLHTVVEKLDHCRPAISPSSTAPSSLISNHRQHQQQHHLRAMPSLHRAPVFHPPTQHALERKEAADRDREREKERERAGYGRLSPPTLTPIQPVSLAATGGKRSEEQQKPPTLLPELRDVKGLGTASASIVSAISGDIMTPSTDSLRGGEMSHERGGLLAGEKGVVKRTPQAATASVIVHPSTSLKYDSSVGANKSGAIILKDLSQGKLYPPKLQGECPRLGESLKDHGVVRVIQPNSNMCLQYKKTAMRGMMGTMGVSTTKSVCKSAVSSAFVVQSMSGATTPELGYSASCHSEVSVHKSGICGQTLQHFGPGENQGSLGPNTTLSEGSLPPYCPSRKRQPSPSFIPRSSSISGSSYPYSPSFVHLKKHKAALAAAQSRCNSSTAPMSITLGNSSLTVDPLDKTPTCSSPPPPPISQISSSAIEKSSNSSVSGRTAPGKSSPIPNGQSPGPSSTSSGQAINYHKLKKAWLTRHSEEDRNTTATASSAVLTTDKVLSTTSTVTPKPINTTAMSEMIKPCTVNLSASTSSEVELNKDTGNKEEKEKQSEEKLGGAAGAEERKSAPSLRRGNKRTYESASESGGDDSDASESKMEGRAKRQPKPTYKKKQNDMAKKKGESEKDEDDGKPNGIFRSAKEKTKLKMASSNGIPRSVLKDWRKVKKLKQTGESFLQDDSCSEIGANLQKCRECRVVRSKKGEEPVHSPVFCRFYYFRRLSYSKNGIIRMDGFSTPDQFDNEALALWIPGTMEDSHLDQITAKYILSLIGDKFCQMVVMENTAASWLKKDAKLVWKRAVRGVREMCDACEATLFNIHWVCQKCGFVVCLDCYKAKERRNSKDKELYAWLKCVKGQPHDHKHLMPTQIIPGTVLSELVTSMHSLREKHNIKSHCICTNKQNLLNKIAATNGVSQVLQNVLNHSNKLSLVKAESGFQQQSSDQGGIKVETNRGRGGSTSPCRDTGSPSLTPPESQSPLHFLADLAEQKSREEKKENKDLMKLGKSIKEEKEGDSLEVLQQCKTTSLVANSTEQGSTLRDLLTNTAGKLKLGSTDAGIAFAPVYSTASQTGKGGRTMPNILDDIIASVVENKIPASRQNIATKLSIKHEPMSHCNNNPVPIISEETKPDRKKSTAVIQASTEESSNQYQDIPHCWLNNRRLLWLKDHRNQDNWKLFRESWKLGQPVLVSGIHKRLNASLWKAESFNQEFADHQGDLLNCKDQVVSNSGIKEFWDGFEDITKRLKSKNGDPMVYRLKDWPSGEEFMALMPSRYDDLMKNLPLPEYSDPEGNLNLASHLPSFFVRPDLGPRLCCAYGVAASQDQDFGTANLHVEVSDVVSVLVYVGVAKGNGVLSKTGVLKRLEEEDLDEGVRKRLKDSSETPGALWHIYLNKDMEKVQEFLHKLCKEQGMDMSLSQDPIREQGWYLSRKQRQRLQDDHGVQGWTIVQFLGDSVLIPAGAMHQVQNLHSCVQVINDFVSPEHVTNSFHLTQELRPSKEEVNYEDKLQVKNILYHCVKEAVHSLKWSTNGEEKEEEHS